MTDVYWTPPPAASTDPAELEHHVDEILRQAGGKATRSLAALVYSLANPKSYREPGDRDYLELLQSPEAGIEQFLLSEEQRNRRGQLIERLLALPPVAPVVSTEGAWQALAALLEEELGVRALHGPRRSEGDLLRALLRLLLAGVAPMRYCFPVSGVKLEDGRPFVDFGPARVFTVTDEVISWTCAVPDGADEGSRRFHELHERYMVENQRGLTCLAFTVLGDEFKARDVARLAAARCMAALRFACCLLYPHAATADRFHIHVPERLGGCLPIIPIGRAGSNLASVSSLPFRGKQKLILDGEVIALMQDYGLDELFALLFRPETEMTELERSILRATEWVGDAQDDTSDAAAFTKYWIALETLLSIQHGDLTYLLRRSIPTLLHYGHGFISESQLAVTKKDVSRLYEFRGETVHRGERAVTCDDLTAVREYSTLLLVTFLGLRRFGYYTHETVDEEIARLHVIGLRFAAIGRSRIVHVNSCPWVVKNARKRLREFETLEQARSKGLRQCRVCLP